MGMIGFGRWSVGDELGLCPPTACLLQGDGETMLMEPLGQGEELMIGLEGGVWGMNLGFAPYGLLTTRGW